jgi:hypothetical protein
MKHQKNHAILLSAELVAKNRFKSEADALASMGPIR